MRSIAYDVPAHVRGASSSSCPGSRTGSGSYLADGAPRSRAAVPRRNRRAFAAIAGEAGAAWDLRDGDGIECSVDHEVVGKIGRVTGTVAPGKVGEIMLPVRGGTEAFNAYAGARDDTIERGARVIVVEYHPPRTVIVVLA